MIKDEVLVKSRYYYCLLIRRIQLRFSYWNFSILPRPPSVIEYSGGYCATKIRVFYFNLVTTSTQKEAWLNLDMDPVWDLLGLRANAWEKGDISQYCGARDENSEIKGNINNGAWLCQRMNDAVEGGGEDGRPDRWGDERGDDDNIEASRSVNLACYLGLFCGRLWRDLILRLNIRF